MTPTHIQALRSISESTRERMERDARKRKMEAAGCVTWFDDGKWEQIEAGPRPLYRFTPACIPHEGKVK